MVVANVICHGRIKRAQSVREDFSIYIYIYIFKGLTPVRLPPKSRSCCTKKRLGDTAVNLVCFKRLRSCTGSSHVRALPTLASANFESKDVKEEVSGEFSDYEYYMIDSNFAAMTGRHESVEGLGRWL